MESRRGEIMRVCNIQGVYERMENQARCMHEARPKVCRGVGREEGDTA